ncbi:hypothetical protein Tco_0638350 [Tanacetum coccineum]
MAFPRLQELAAAQNSNNLTDAMSVYIERKINDDLHFAAGLSHLWEVLYSRVNEHRLLIAKLNVFDGPLALQCAEFFTQLSQTEVLKMLEIRKSISEIRMIPVRLYLLLYYVHGDDEVGTWVAIFVVLFRQGSWYLSCADIKKRTKIKTKPDKIKHMIEKSARKQVQRCLRILLGQPVTRLMGQLVSSDPRLQSKKSAMDRSFTLGSTEESDPFKILVVLQWLASGGDSGIA